MTAGTATISVFRNFCGSAAPFQADVKLSSVSVCAIET